MKIIIELNSFEEIHKLKEWLNNTNLPDKTDLSMSIAVLNLAVRTKNCLLAEGIETLDDLIKWSVVDLLRTPSLGKKSLGEITEALSKYNLFLNPNG